MTENDPQPQELDKELDEMEERSDALKDEIDDTRKDWERKKQDSSVPGAAGAPERADDDDAPEATYPTKR